MIVETPGGRVTRRPRGVSGERERGARAPGLGPCVRAREPVVTYRVPRPGPTPSALSRGAGRGPVRALEGRREVETRTDRHAWASSPSSSRRPPSPDGFSKTSAPALAPAGRETLRARPRRDDLRNLFLCRSPRKRGGGPRVLGRAARLTEGPLKPRARDHALRERESERAPRRARDTYGNVPRAFAERTRREKRLP